MAFREIPEAKYCTFKKGDIIINEGEKVNDLYYLVSGQVERISINENGEKNTLGIKAEKNGVASLLGIYYAYDDEKDRYSAFVFKAASRCVCYKIPIKNYRQWVRSKPDIMEETILYFKNDYTQTLDMLSAHIKGDTSKEVCKFLLKNAVKKNDRYIVPKKRYLKDLAVVLNVHKVTISRIMRKLKEKGIVVRTEEGIEILNYKELEHYTKECMKYR